mmetsp:Transcript_41588/g.98593  ORF Transcript_41588/g.98593 Transcript_41588/m.98593 type:complete len:239 (-) Transcript_41588:213-929(-)
MGERRPSQPDMVGESCSEDPFSPPLRGGSSSSPSLGVESPSLATQAFFGWDSSGGLRLCPGSSDSSSAPSATFSCCCCCSRRACFLLKTIHTTTAARAAMATAAADAETAIMRTRLSSSSPPPLPDSGATGGAEPPRRIVSSGSSMLRTTTAPSCEGAARSEMKKSFMVLTSSGVKLWRGSGGKMAIRSCRLPVLVWRTATSMPAMSMEPEIHWTMSLWSSPALLSVRSAKSSSTMNG